MVIALTPTRRCPLLAFPDPEISIIERLGARFARVVAVACLANLTGWGANLTRTVRWRLWNFSHLRNLTA